MNAKHRPTPRPVAVESTPGGALQVKRKPARLSFDAAAFLDENTSKLSSRDGIEPTPLPAEAWAVVDEANRRRTAGSAIELAPLTRLLQQSFGIKLGRSALRERILKHVGRTQW